MNQAEQESLLLRQLAALRRRGHAHVEALELASAGLPPGPLADRVQAALRQLAAGEPEPGSSDPLLVTNGAPDALEHAARAIDARLAADASLVTVRLYLSVAIAVPLLMLSALAFVFLPALDADPSLRLVGKVVALVRVAAPVLAVVAVFGAGRYTRRLAPGFHKLNRAGALLDAAAAGSDPILALDETVEIDYFCSRRGAAGPSQAAIELARELVREGEASVLRFRHVAPLVLVVLGAPLLWALWFAVWLTPAGETLRYFF